MTPYGNRLDALIVSLSKGRRKRKKKRTMTSGSLCHSLWNRFRGPNLGATVEVEAKKVELQEVKGAPKLKVEV